MKKQKLKNKPFKRTYLTPFLRGLYSLCLLFLGTTLPAYAQDVNPCSSIQVVGFFENDTPNNAGVVFQGIVVSNEVTPNQSIRIYNENWELINECTSDQCGNPFTYPTGEGKYFVQVVLYNEDETFLCQADPFEVIVEDDPNPCATFCNQAIVEFNSQAEVDAFCGCEEISGLVRISGDVTSLAPLQGLKKIGEFLAIFKTELTNLKDLENLESVGTDIYIADNSLLTSLEGLGKVTTLEGAFIVEQHPKLESLDGINLERISSLSISSNDALVDISALKNLTDLSSLSFIANKSLKNLEGLNQLTNIGKGPITNGNGGSLFIAANETLENLDALKNIQFNGDVIILDSNKGLTNCCGIAHLLDEDQNNDQRGIRLQIQNNAPGCNSVAEILANCQSSPIDCNDVVVSINSNNSQTIDIAGLVTPHYIVKVYDADWNQVLSCTDDCTAIGEYEAGLYRIHVQLYDEDWQFICETDFLKITIEGTDCTTPQAVCQGDINLTTQAEVDAVCGCEVIEGNVRITGADITSLEPLKALRKVGGFLAISGTKLENLQGLNNLESVGDAFVLIKNSQLLNYEGLDKLATIESTFSTDQNPILKSMEGLNALMQVNGNISIIGNDQLLNISALKNIQKLRRNISIIGNKSIKTLDGLNGLKSIGEGPIRGGPSSSLVIVGNTSLENLDALANLQVLKENMSIQNNSSLSDCCGIAHLIDDDPNNGQANEGLTIDNNSEGCNSVEEILANCRIDNGNPCANVSLSLDENNPGRIYVNGRNSQIQLLTLYDAHWNKIWDGTCDKGNPLTTCNAFGVHPPGLYRVYVRMFDENWQYLCETDFLEIEIPEEAGRSRENKDLINENEITLFPNPVHHTLKLRTNALSGKKGSIQIFNAFGQQVGFIPEKEFTNSFETIDITAYQNGLYFMSIKVGNQRTISKKFFVEKLE